MAASLLGQLVSPFHLPTHEFTQAFAAVGGVGLFFLGVTLCRRAPDRASLALHATIALGLLSGAAAFTVHALFNAALHDCRIGAASVFFWITWGPLAAFFAVLGVTAGERAWSRWRALALLTGVVVASLVHDVLQVMTGVRLSDPLLGEPLSLSQRATMEITAAQIAQRIWLAGLAVVVWQLRAGRVQPNAATKLRVTLSAGIFAIVTLLAGAELGVGWSRSALRARLGEERRTEHFLIRYNESGRGSLHVDAIARAAEWELHDLTTAWGVAPERVVKIRVYDDMDQMRRLTGHASSAHAGPWHIDLTWWRGLTTTLRHELVHALHVELSRRPELLFLPGHVEGTAVAWADDLVNLPDAHVEQAAALRAGHLPSAPELMSFGGFLKVNERAAYKAAGSFIGWLVLTRGFDDFARLQRTLDFEAVYGRDLQGLDSEWRRFLDTVAVPIETVAEARDSFDPSIAPAYLSTSCPKLGCRDERLEDTAFRQFSAADYDGAFASYERLYETEGRLHWLLSAATCLQKQGDHTAALDLLAGPSGDGLTLDERHRLLQARVRSLTALREWDALYAAFDARDSLGAERSVERERIEACLRDVEVRDDIAWAVERDGSAEGRRMLRDLSARYPERQCAQYLAATRGFPVPPSPWSLGLDQVDSERVEAALDDVERAPEVCDRLSERLRALGNWAVDAGAWGIAERVATQVAHACSNPLDRFWARRAIERVGWERGHALPPG